MKDFEKMNLNQLEDELTNKIKGYLEYAKEELVEKIKVQKTKQNKYDNIISDETKKVEKKELQVSIAHLNQEISTLKDKVEELESAAKKRAIIAITAIEQSEDEVVQEKDNRTYLRAIPIKTPLTMIGLFVSILELAGLGVLPLLLNSTNTNLKDNHLTMYIGFLIVFPVLVVVLFFLTLAFRRSSLYAPSDFRDEEHFMEINKEIDKIDKKVEELKITVKEAKEVTDELSERVDKTKEELHKRVNITKEELLNKVDKTKEELSKKVDETKGMMRELYDNTFDDDD